MKAVKPVKSPRKNVHDYISYVMASELAAVEIEIMELVPQKPCRQ